MKSNFTVKTLVLSLVSVAICATLLTGITYAWFTDSVTSTHNTITAGDLRVDLMSCEITNGQPVVGESLKGKSFIAESNVAPGSQFVRYVCVKNVGTLPLDYNFSFTTGNTTMDKYVNIQIKKLDKANGLSQIGDAYNYTGVSINTSKDIGGQITRAEDYDVYEFDFSFTNEAGNDVNTPDKDQFIFDAKVDARQVSQTSNG